MLAQIWDRDGGAFGKSKVEWHNEAHWLVAFCFFHSPGRRALVGAIQGQLGTQQRNFHVT